MKKIIVAYWHGDIKGFKYPDRQEYPYSAEKRNEIIDYSIEQMFAVMLKPTEQNTLFIWIDKGTFRQR